MVQGQNLSDSINWDGGWSGVLQLDSELESVSPEHS